MTTTKKFASGDNSFTGFSWEQYIITDLGGNDHFVVGDQSDLVWAGSGNDYVLGWGGNDMIDGQGGDDKLDGANGDDLLVGGAGKDKLYGGEGDDDLFGGDSADLLEGYNGHDQLDGGSGADLLYGAGGHDILRGGGGNDQLFGGAGVNSIDGGSGIDTVRMDEDFNWMMPKDGRGWRTDAPLAYVDLQSGVAKIVGDIPTKVYVTNTVVNVENIVGTAEYYPALVHGFADVLRATAQTITSTLRHGDDLLERSRRK